MSPLDARIQRLLDGDLTADEERALRAAVAQDPQASRDLAQLEGGIASLASRPAPELPEGFQARVMSRVAARPAPQVRLGPAAAILDLLAGLSWPRAAALASLVVLVAGGAGLVGYHAGTRAAPAPAPAPTASATAPATVLVRFTLTAPEARQVELAGTFNRWGERKVALARGSHGSWTATVELPRGRYEYAFVVDGERFVPDSGAADFVDDGFGERNAVLDI